MPDNEKWSFFESLDEMVYVTDVETNELVYMNRHLRSALEYRTHEEYRGRKCYEVLQGCEEPCSFCNNAQLRPGEFVSWTHKNPVLNQRFLIKDSMVEMGGRRYRVEIAINLDSEIASGTPYYYARSETILNECLQQMFTSTDPDESTNHLLSYIGQTFSCERVYIFELHGATTDNTYEWCAEGVTPQKDVLQKVPADYLNWWYNSFDKSQIIIIPDLEQIRQEYPETYAVLKPQNIRSLAAGPIREDGKLIGFIGVDNPEPEMMRLITPLLKVVGYFAATLLKRRDLLAKLHELSYHDQLTGALNRNALAEYYGQLPMDSAGVIYCDITGLKRINDTQGHEAGDRMIRHCYDLIRKSVDTKLIYRTGGDEFIALCPNVAEVDFERCLRRLRHAIRQDEYHLAMGHTWSKDQPLIMEDLITQADQVMYQDKRDYYRQNSRLPGVERRKVREVDYGDDAAPEKTVPETPFQCFMATAAYDVEAMVQSVAQDNSSSYFYMGDMQKGLFYISDNMRDDFGFQSNLVQDLLTVWAKRISTPEFQDLYWQDLSSMMREKRSIHDLRYRVRDVHGNSKWIRCYGVLTWNADKTKPVFFSGRVTHQDNDFVVDPVTSFPREHAALQQLEEMRKDGAPTVVIGFSLNGLTEINSTKGRAYGDRLLKRFTDALMEGLCWKMSFYRLEGMRFLAIVNPLCIGEGTAALVEQIRTIAVDCYEAMGVAGQKVCSFGVMEYPGPGWKPEDLLENLLSLIRVAKQEAKLAYVDYSEESVRRIRQMSNMTMALRQDVDHNMEHFRIVVQPVVSAETGRAKGGEVLLRWRFEDRDVSPAVFIPILEKEKMIHEVGRWVFEQAVCTCVRLRSYDPNFYLTFNVSLQQLSDPLLLPEMAKILQKYNLCGGGLVAELTESCLDEEPEKLLEFVGACQNLGMRIALDDFGSGYSSLRMLLQYPSSIIKLDRSLVMEATESEAKMNFIRSIVYACHQFGKTVCMEGVERADENEMIRNTGCDLIQGYYYYRPMELSDVYRLISRSDEQTEEGGDAHGAGI